MAAVRIYMEHTSFGSESLPPFAQDYVTLYIELDEKKEKEALLGPHARTDVENYEGDV